MEAVHPQSIEVCFTQGDASIITMIMCQKLAAIELSHFDGKNLKALVFQVERYFEFYTFPCILTFIGFILP